MAINHVNYWELQKWNIMLPETQNKSQFEKIMNHD